MTAFCHSGIDQFYINPQSLTDALLIQIRIPSSKLNYSLHICYSRCCTKQMKPHGLTFQTMPVACLCDKVSGRKVILNLHRSGSQPGALLLLQLMKAIQWNSDYMKCDHSYRLQISRYYLDSNYAMKSLHRCGNMYAIICNDAITKRNRTFAWFASSATNTSVNKIMTFISFRHWACIFLNFWITQCPNVLVLTLDSNLLYTIMKRHLCCQYFMLRCRWKFPKKVHFPP